MPRARIAEAAQAESREVRQRATASQHLTRRGLEVHKSQLLGRWVSDVILSYSREAPLAAVIGDVRALQEAATESLAKSPFLPLDIMERVIDQVRYELSERASRSTTPSPEMACNEPTQWVVVANRSMRMLHTAQRDRRASPPIIWQSIGGRRFGAVLYDEFGVLSQGGGAVQNVFLTYTMSVRLVWQLSLIDGARSGVPCRVSHRHVHIVEQTQRSRCGRGRG